MTTEQLTTVISAAMDVARISLKLDERADQEFAKPIMSESLEHIAERHQIKDNIDWQRVVDYIFLVADKHLTSKT